MSKVGQFLHRSFIILIHYCSKRALHKGVKVDQNSIQLLTDKLVVSKLSHMFRRSAICTIYIMLYSRPRASLTELPWKFCMLHSCIQGYSFSKHRQITDFAWKNHTKFPSNMPSFHKISMQNWQNLSQNNFPMYVFTTSPRQSSASYLWFLN